MSNIFMAGPSITELEISTVNDMMKNGWYEHAYDYVETFEKEFAVYHNRKYALMTPNATSAIHLLLLALDIKEGDEVIVPECTWIASCAPVIYQKATPVFCDIDPINWCISPESLKSKISKRTKAIILVDLFGNMPLMDEILSIAASHGIPVIEDSAEALGSQYKGNRAGKFGIGSVFSFHRTKTLTTGEGGMLLTDDDTIFEKAAIFRDHGRRKSGPMYFNFEVGYKYMPSNLAASLGHAQFLRIEELVNRKREILKAYKTNLSEVNDIQLNDEPDHVVNGCWSPALVIGESYDIKKDRLMKELNDLGYPARPFFYPLSMLPAFEKWKGDCQFENTVAYDISSRGINLPAALNITDEQIKEYCNAIKEVIL